MSPCNLVEGFWYNSSTQNVVEGIWYNLGQNLVKGIWYNRKKSLLFNLGIWYKEFDIMALQNLV